MRILGGFGFLSGASYPFRALRVLQKNPPLWGYLITPILVNIILAIVIYGGLLFFSWPWLSELMLSLSSWGDQLIADLPRWLGILEYLIVGIDLLIRFFVIVVLLFITGFVFTEFGVLLGAPWYGQLSEKLEKLRTGQVETIEVGIVRDIGRAILFEIKKLLLSIPIGIALFALNFIPGFGTLIATIGGVILTTTIVCLDFLDGPSERRRFKFRRKLCIVFRTFPASAGFSLVCFGLISIPLLNLLTIPLCVASGTLFWCDRVAHLR
ncbi:MAG: EI24 domain-containing protein [Chroococcales cyanobacterium]